MRAETLSEYKKIVENFAAKMSFQKKTIVLLSGDMGAGKTQFVKYFLEYFGCQDAVSPTFSLHQSYKLQDGHLVDHWDLFRLENEEEVESAGFWDQFLSPRYFIFIEWPERIELKFLPRDGETVQIKIAIEGAARRITVQRSLQ